MLHPHFAGADGRQLAHPLAASGHPPTVDLNGLARLFTTPVLFGEFAPSSYWRGVDLVWNPPLPSDDERPFAVVFAEAVSRSCADAETVAVALSGGVDSLAVLWHVTQLHPRRKLTALVVDLIDDCGESASAVTHRLLAELDLVDLVEVVVVDPYLCHEEPPWSPFGPRMDALPKVNATLSLRAEEAGAQILLSGNGADELLAVPRYATTQVADVHGWRAASRYLSDMASAGFGRWGEFAGLLTNLLGAGQRSRTYAAATWPQWCHPEASPVLREPWRDEALMWTQDWVRATLAAHEDAGRSWAEADAWDSWWPRAYIPAAGPLPEAAPFCDAAVASAVWGKPLGWRYDPTERTAYLRVKGQVGQLFPDHIRRMLPSQKRYYSNALGLSAASNNAVNTAADLGLLDPIAVEASTCTATRMMAVAVDAWLAGALAAGAEAAR